MSDEQQTTTSDPNFRSGSLASREQRHAAAMELRKFLKDGAMVVDPDNSVTPEPPVAAETEPLKKV